MKKSIFMLTAAALMASCTDNVDNLSLPAGDGVDIQVKPIHESVKGELTRAPFLGNISATNHLEARVITYDNALSGAMHADGTMTFKAANDATGYAAEVDNRKFGKTGTDLFFLVGLYPADGWAGAGENFSTDVAAFEFDGSQDIMITEVKTTTPDATAGGTYPTLSFSHQLTKLQIKVKAKDEDAAAKWSGLKEIKLTQVLGSGDIQNAFAYTINSGTTEFSGEKNEFPFYIIDNTAETPVYTSDVFKNQTVDIQIPNEAGTNIVPLAYSMIAPFASIANGDLKFAVKAMCDDDNDDTTLPVEKTTDVIVSIPELPTTQGYAYSITLTFSDTDRITAMANVIEWIDSGDEIEQVIL